MVKQIAYIALLALLLCGCEVIPEDERFIPVDAASYGSRTHVLLDFTGFRCVNCPTAAETARTLQEMYGRNLTVVSLHPASNPFTQGKYDYTCPAADSVYRWMGGDASTPFPAGNLNMQAYAGEWFVNMSEWATMVYQAQSDSVCPHLSLTAEMDPGAPEEVSALVSCSSVEAQLAVWLVEDSVLGVQAMPDGTVSTEYYHRHMLRAVAGDKPFGVPVTDRTMNVSIRLPDGCNIRHLSLVALLLDNKDNHILQAYEKKLFNAGLVPPVGD